MENRFAIRNFIGYRTFYVCVHNRSTLSTNCFNTAVRRVPIQVQNKNEAKKKDDFFKLVLYVDICVLMMEPNRLQCSPYRHHQHYDCIICKLNTIFGCLHAARVSRKCKCHGTYAFQSF